jgi:hypothetical protein
MRHGMIAMVLGRLALILSTGCLASGAEPGPDETTVDSALTRFRSPAQWSSFFCVNGEVCMAGDVNGDGRTDIIAFNHGINGGANAVFVGLSDGTKFGAAQRWSDFFCVGTETCLVGDVNGDRRADIVAATGNPNADIYVALSNGARFGAAQRWSTFFCRTGEVCKLADVNGDGRADLLAFNHGIDNGATGVWVGLSNGSSFAAPQRWHSSFCGATATCEVADVNGNGESDILLFSRGTIPHATFALSTGTSFAAARSASSLFCRDGEVCRAADFNGDGRADLVAFNHGINGGTTAAFVSESLGEDFTAPQQVSAFFCVAGETCEVGDVNGDRRADLIAFTRGPTPRAFVSTSIP